MLDRILDFIYPPKCAFCREILAEKAPVCTDCMATLPFIDDDACECCGIPIDEYSYRLCNHCNSEKRYFEHSFVPLRYEDKAKSTVLLFKHHQHAYFAKALAFLMADRILSSPFYTDFTHITCVPESRKTTTARGYNQSELLAKELSKILKVPFVQTLERANKGAKQATLNREERRKNVRKCYLKGKSTFDKGTVLLVDDVYTTGETVNYCAKLLKEIGFDKVYVTVATIRCSD